MALSMYDASIPVFKHSLGSMSTILRKAEDFAVSRQIDPAALTGFRLFPDMLPLTRQVQIATDHARSGAARLAGLAVPVYEDDEVTFADLRGRIARTIAFLDTLAPAQLEGSETRDIVFQVGDLTFEFKGQAYLLHWVLPNFFFHATTSYNIFRHNGVELAKKDFLAGDTTASG